MLIPVTPLSCTFCGLHAGRRRLEQAVESTDELERLLQTPVRCSALAHGMAVPVKRPLYSCAGGRDPDQSSLCTATAGNTKRGK